VIARCFRVDSYRDLWRDDGSNNVGAMIWRHHKVDEHDSDPRPFPHLGVVTPAGLVCLDCPESDPPYGKWTRTGEPPNITVTPSLNVNNDTWHGFLTDGVLTP
jgi:hypothetical protein